ncbi:hypothetical protein JD969_14835 [Planctomycetota bacterium]|nr:hypothetical protein JD969_14835 [Planctomycetota bacterium]
MSERSPEELLEELNRLEHVRIAHDENPCNRHFDRHIVRGEAELHPMNRSKLDPTPIEVQLRDVGRGGLGFISQDSLPLGSTWRICFTKRGFVVGQQAIIVKYSHQVSTGVYLIGSQFIIDTGLLTLLGVNPAAIDKEDSEIIEANEDVSFLPPADVA